MMNIKPGDICLVDIYFTDGSASKIRPVLVLWIDGSDVVVSAITSATPRSKTDVMLKDWAKSGLKVPSCVRLSRLDCLESLLFFKGLGSLSKADKKEILTRWKEHVYPKF